MAYSVSRMAHSHPRYAIRHPLSAICHFILNRPNPFHLTLHHIARFQPFGRGAPGAHAARRAGGDHVARFESHPARERFEDRRNFIDQILGVTVLLRHAIDATAHIQVVRIGNLIGGDNPGIGQQPSKLFPLKNCP